jgi:serine/threonine protein kinase
VLGFIGAGRKSETYLAWDGRRRSTVAAKLLRPGRPVSKLGREAELLERLTHPVLVRSFGATLEGSTPHLALEHVAGPSVRAVMRRGPMAPETVAAVGLQVATALHYLATEGFVHLDVKPQNILLTSPLPQHAAESGWPERREERGDGELPTVRLIDAAAIKPVGSVVKALGGAVPELGTRESRAAPAAGVWLLGATMWRMLGGGRALPGGGPALPDGAPAPLVDLVRACVDEEPSARPSAGEVADALAPLAAGSRSPEPPAPATRGARLRGWLVEGRRT